MYVVIRVDRRKYNSLEFFAACARLLRSPADLFYDKFMIRSCWKVKLICCRDLVSFKSCRGSQRN